MNSTKKRDREYFTSFLKLFIKWRSKNSMTVITLITLLLSTPFPRFDSATNRTLRQVICTIIFKHQSFC